MGTFQVLSRSERVATRNAIPSEIRRTSAPISAADGVPTFVSSAKGQATAGAAVSGVASPAPCAGQSRDLWAWAAGVVAVGTALMLVRVGWMMARRDAPAAALLLRSPRARSPNAVEQLRRSMRIAPRVRVAAGGTFACRRCAVRSGPSSPSRIARANELSIAQVRMILAHELRTSGRHDYLVNLLQLLVEAVLFFNPAVWWLSRQVPHRARGPAATRRPSARWAASRTMWNRSPTSWPICSVPASDSRDSG